MKKTKLAILFYISTVVFFLRGILFSPGIITGSDWYIPLTVSQIKNFTSIIFQTWGGNALVFGVRQAHLNTYLFRSFLYVLSKLGLGGDTITKLLLVFLLSFIGYSAFWFCQKLKVSWKHSLLAGFLYMTTPVVFNYAIMGWIFVLWVIALIPFFIFHFEQAVQKNSTKSALVSGIIFSLAIFQSQALFWFPLIVLVSLPFIIKSKKHLVSLVKTSVIVGVAAFATHANWILPLLVSPDVQISKAVSILDAVRFEHRLGFTNAIRLWGSLYNQPYETVYSKVLLPFSYTLPLLALLGVLVSKHKKRFFLATLAVTPFVLYGLRGILYHIPFSNVIRDLSRLLVLMTLPYVVLATFFAEKVKDRSFRFIIYLFFLIPTLPFWFGGLYALHKESPDVRLRTLQFPEEYNEVEDLVSSIVTDTKTLWLPSGSGFGITNNFDFYGPHQEIPDLFGFFSNKPGGLSLSDKYCGAFSSTGHTILDSFYKGDMETVGELLRTTSVDTIVVRKNVRGQGGGGVEIAKSLESASWASKIYEGAEIAVFSVSDYLPHFFVLESTSYIDTDSNKSISVERKEFMGGTENIIWDEGWVLPAVNVPPESFKYRLVLLKELLVEQKASASLEKVDVLLWHASKRMEEFSKWDYVNGIDLFLKKITKAIDVLQTIPVEEWDSNYFEMIGKVIAYMRKAEEKSHQNSSVQSLVSEFTDWAETAFSSWCGEDAYCYTVMLPDNGDYEVVSDMEGTIIKNVTEDGELRIQLSLSEMPNLIMDSGWEVASPTQPSLVGLPTESEGENGSFEFLFFSNSLQEQVVKDWSAWKEYALSFDYRVGEGDLGVAVVESKFNYDKLVFAGAEHTEENFYNSDFYELEKLTDRTFQKTSDWEKMKIKLSADNDARGAVVYFYTSSIGEKLPIVEIGNVSVTEVLHPKVVLRPIELDTVVEHVAPKISFAKVNKTKYRVWVKGAIVPYTFVFNESYHEGWRVYEGLASLEVRPPKGGIVAEHLQGNVVEHQHRNNIFDKTVFETWGKNPLDVEHFVVNDYANAWYITPESVGGEKSYELIVEFVPQKYSMAGLLLGVVGVLSFGILYRCVSKSSSQH